MPVAGAPPPRLPLRKAWAVIGPHLSPNTYECIIVAAAAAATADIRTVASERLQVCRRVKCKQ